MQSVDILVTRVSSAGLQGLKLLFQTAAKAAGQVYREESLLVDDTQIKEQLARTKFTTESTHGCRYASRRLHPQVPDQEVELMCWPQVE